MELNMNTEDFYENRQFSPVTDVIATEKVGKAEDESGAGSSLAVSSTDASTQKVAKQAFVGMKKEAERQTLFEMKIGDSKVAYSFKASLPSEEGGAVFKTLAKEGFYQKWIQSSREATEQEISVERQEKRFQEHRDVLKARFKNFLREVEEKKRSAIIEQKEP